MEKKHPGHQKINKKKCSLTATTNFEESGFHCINLLIPLSVKHLSDLLKCVIGTFGLQNQIDKESSNKIQNKIFTLSASICNIVVESSLFESSNFGHPIEKYIVINLARITVNYCEGKGFNY